MMFQYFVKVVPTVYMKVDGEVSPRGPDFRAPPGAKPENSFTLGSEVLFLPHMMGDRLRLRRGWVTCPIARAQAPACQSSEHFFSLPPTPPVYTLCLSVPHGLPWARG